MLDAHLNVGYIGPFYVYSLFHLQKYYYTDNSRAVMSSCNTFAAVLSPTSSTVTFSVLTANRITTENPR